MRAILISIRPQWVEKILNGEKTVEIRKTKPNIKLPCKVYIYCTKAKPTLQYFYNWRNYKPISEYSTWAAGSTINAGEYGNGKIVAEFTLKNISYWQSYWTPEVMHICDISEKSCVSTEVLVQYCGDGIIYAWHVEDLKIYDKPKELSEFSHYIPNNKCPKKECGIDCEDCMSYDGEHETCLALYYSHWQIKRPPQSWCYVNDLEGDAV